MNQDDTNKLYTDFTFIHKFEKDDFNPPDKSTLELLGIYEFKPVAQEQWEKMITSALDNVADLFPYIDDIWHLPGNEIYTTTADFDIRPRIWDSRSKSWVLVDTGASVSAWPKCMFPDAKIDPGPMLKAVNKTRIETYASINATVQIGRKAYKHEVFVAHVQEPILGSDFIRKYRLSMILNEWDELNLMDRKANISSTLKFEKLPEGTCLEHAPLDQE